jgi:hypothetical protein
MLLNELHRSIPFSKDDLNQIDHYNKLIDNHENDTMEKLHNYLSSNGYKFINAGSSTSAYSTPNGKFILKINNDIDRPFAWFALLTHQFPNKHFPIIGDAKFIHTNSGQKLYIYKVERLQELPSQISTKVSAAIEYILEYDLFSLYGYDLNRNQMEEKLSLDLPSKPREKLHSIFDRLGDEEMFDALKIIYKYKKEYEFDLGKYNPGNLMQNTGTIIINDPYTY